RAMQGRRRAVAVLSSRARASRLRPSATRSRDRSGLSWAERRPETPPRRLTPKSTWLTLASGTRGGRESGAARTLAARGGAPPEDVRAVFDLVAARVRGAPPVVVRAVFDLVDREDVGIDEPRPTSYRRASSS